MPVNLHERLSEFSYGYGVTREVEARIAAANLLVTPFLPSLVQEASLGFDVAFDLPGTPLLLQFKLGEELRRFRGGVALPVAPRPLSRPFWRYRIDTSEDQFRHLREWERRGANVYYVSPRFSTWREFDRAFRRNEVLSHSLLITPRDIRAALTNQRSRAGVHRILYDRRRRYVCSDPVAINEVSPEALVEEVRVRVQEVPVSLRNRLKEIARPVEGSQTLDAERIADIRRRAKSEDDAEGMILALEAWTRGAQLLFVTQRRETSSLGG